MNELLLKMSFQFQETDFSVLDDERQLERADRFEQNFELCVNYIAKIVDVAKFSNDKRSLKACKFIRYNSFKNNKFIDVFIKYEKVIEVFQKLFEYYLSEFKRLGINDCKKLDLTAFNHVLSIVLNSTNESKEFQIKFHDFNGTKILLRFINDDDIIEKCQQLKRNVVINGKEPSLLRAIATTIYNLSFLGDSHKNDFNNLNATTIISKFLNNKSIDDDFRMCASLTLANILNNNEIETLPNLNLALNGLIHLLHQASIMISSKMNLKRIQIQTEINGEDLIADICTIDTTWCTWHIKEVLTGLYRISINDKIKSEIYDKTKEDLKLIIYNGTDFEKAFALQVLWQLCFDNKIGKKVKDDKQLYDCIQQFAQQINLKIKNLQYFASGILWSVDKVTQLQNQISIKNVAPINKKKHVMISYNCESRKLCMEIKNKIMEKGYDVWIDIERIEGSSLESMAKAVENSLCVLICMTEKYKQSVYCRAEAEYTFMQKIPFIPIILQANFTPDGWLGIITGSKIRVNFVKYDFEDSIKKVLFQLNAAIGNDEAESNKIPINLNTCTENNSIKKWTQADVQEWLTKIQTNEELRKTLYSFDGEMLIQLNRIKKTAPDYFFTAISRNNSIELFHVIKFTLEFEILFEVFK